MEENGENRVCAKRLGYRRWGLDRLTNLPDCLLLRILSNLPTKDAVKCSVLSRRWRNLWRYVPVLDLECGDFIVDDAKYIGGYVYYCAGPDFIAFVSFVDKFLGFNSESCIEKFRMKVDWYDEVELDIAHFTRWINTVIERKVKHLHVLDKVWGVDEVEIPSTVYMSESLVSLKLCDVYLPNPGRMSLPSVKVIDLDKVVFHDDQAFEMLISGRSVLESLTMSLGLYSHDNLKTYRVCSQSLLSFTHVANIVKGMIEDRTVVIDAPRLERLRLSDHRTASFITKNPGSLIEADIDVVFNLCFGKKLDANDLRKRSMIRDFLIWISCVKNMKIYSTTLEVIYDYSRCEPLPLFRNLSFLRVEFSDYR